MRRLIIVLALIVAGLLVGAPAIAGGGGGCHEGYSSGADTTLEISQNCFELVVTRIERGESVTWTNQDLYPHNVYSIAFGGSEELAQGDSFSHRFDEIGVFPYVCTLHPGMMAAVVVGGEGEGVANTPSSAGVTPVATSPTGFTEANESLVTDASSASASSSPVSVPLAAGLMSLGGVLVGLGLAGGLVLGSRREPLKAR